MRGADPARCARTAARSNTDWYTVAGGDGFYTRQDPTDWAIVYGESQDGNMSRHDLRAGTQKSIRPNAGRGAAAAVEAATHGGIGQPDCTDRRRMRPARRAATPRRDAWRSGGSWQPAGKAAAVDAAARPT